MIENKEIINKDVNENKTEDIIVKSAKESKPRLQQLDWARTQSVQNVILGHLQMNLVDMQQDQQQRKVAAIRTSHGREDLRVAQQMVDSGLLHTIPLFFGLSGLLTSITMRKEERFQMFVQKRLSRLILPFVSGGVVAILPRLYIDPRLQILYVKDGELTFVFFLQAWAMSELWFLWALFIMNLINYAFCKMKKCITQWKTCADNGLSQPKEDIKWFCMQTAFSLAILIGWIVAVGQFNSIPVFSLSLPLGILFSSLFDALSIVNKQRLKSKLLDEVCSCLSCFVWIAMTFAIAAPALLKDKGEYDFASKNMMIVVTVFEFSYLFFFQFNEEKPTLKQIQARTPDAMIPISFLLLSSWWPVFFFWGENTARRIGPYLTQRDDDQRALGVLKTWFWMLGTFFFAQKFCNTKCVDWLHRHVTSSVLVMQVFHRTFEVVWINAIVREGETEDYKLGKEEAFDFWFCFIIIAILEQATCFAVYLLFLQTALTRKLFGIDDVKKDKTKVKESSSNYSGKDKEKEIEIGNFISVNKD